MAPENPDPDLKDSAGHSDDFAAGEVQSSSDGHLQAWVQRASLVVFVTFCTELGIILVLLPWRPVWTANNLLNHFPHMRSFLGLNMVRGAVSGLGIVDLWIGIAALVKYRELK